MASRRTGRVSRRAGATQRGSEEEPSSRRSSRRSRAADVAPAPAPEPEEEDTGTRRSSRRSSRTGREESGRSSRRSGGGRGTISGREEVLAQRKKKRMLMNGLVVAGVLLLGLIIYAMIPNPNLPVAERQMARVKALVTDFEKEMENENTISAKGIADEIKEILQTPLFAMGKDDPEYYNHDDFANGYFAVEAKNVLNDLERELQEIPDIVAKQDAKRNHDRIMSQINTIKDVESIDELRGLINDYRRNPVDLDGEPDGKIASRFSRYIEAINARMKEVEAEDERRKALSEEKRRQEEAERAKRLAEEEAQRKAEAAAKVAEAQEKVEEERAKAAGEDTDKPRGPDYSKMSNPEIVKKIRELMKEHEFNQARGLMVHLKASEGYDLEGEKARLNADMKVLFTNARQEMQASFNDARQLDRANMVADARTSIKFANEMMDKLIENCEDETVKEELKAMQPMYERMYRKIFN